MCPCVISRPVIHDDAATVPVALTIAGSDSGGGAGIQADLAAFSFLGVLGTTAITAVTAQNPHRVTAVSPLPPATVSAQISAVFEAFAVGAMKTGMLFNADIIRAVAGALDEHRQVPSVVDPVMVATSGAKLLEDNAVHTVCDTLLPLATVITPNWAEAEILLGRALTAADTVSGVAAQLARRFGTHVLVKGGHTAGHDAVDALSDGKQTWELSACRQSVQATHGTGCSLSAAIAAGLACGDDMLNAVRKAKAYVTARLKHCRKAGSETWVMTPPTALALDDVVCRQV